MKIKLVHNTEQYTDKGDFAAMTRTTVLKCARLVSIAGHSCRNAEDLLSSADPPTVDNCRIAETMLDGHTA